jgi:hypothetical protein
MDAMQSRDGEALVRLGHHGRAHAVHDSAEQDFLEVGPVERRRHVAT